jgi:uncharacterized protein YjbI with pentapeptide repeats
MTDRESHETGAVRPLLGEQRQRRYTSVQEVLEAYASGARSFNFAALNEADFGGADLHGASFYCASLRGANFTRACLTHVQFKGADLTEAVLESASINATDLIGATFSNALLAGADLTGASLQRADCRESDMSLVNLGNARLGQSNFLGAVLDRVHLHSTDFSDIDVSPFCEAADLDHSGPSTIDARTVIHSYRHPCIKTFMVDCGVPPIFAEYMIDCARATAEQDLRSMMQSTFISYGGPDEAFARKLYVALRDNNVVVFFFPETARLGERVDTEVVRGLQGHDRVILVCSESSLNRPGVLHEVRETLDREARDGGATYLLPVTLDDYVFTSWPADEPHLAERVARRVVGDFREASHDEAAFNRALRRLLDALKARRIPQESSSE